MAVSTWVKGAIIACAATFAGCAAQLKPKNNDEPARPTAAAPITLFPQQGNSRSVVFSIQCDPKLGDKTAHEFLSNFLEQEDQKKSTLEPDEIQAQAQKRLESLQEFYSKLFSCENKNSEINIIVQELQKEKYKSKPQFDRLYNLIIVNHYKMIADFYDQGYFQAEVGRLVVQKFSELPKKVLETISPIDIKGMGEHLNQILGTQSRTIIAQLIREDLQKIIGAKEYGTSEILEELAEKIYKKAYHDAIVNSAGRSKNNAGGDLKLVSPGLGS